MRSIIVEGDTPQLFLFHGTGGDESDLVPIARMIAPSNAIRSYRGIVEEHGMLRWFPRRGHNEFDLEEVREHVEGVMAGIRADHTDEEIAASVFLGYSNGANAIAAMLQLGVPIRRAALLHPMLILSDERRFDGVELFVSIGARDAMILPAESERLVSFFEGAGAAVTAARFSGGHEVSREEVGSLAAWMARVTARSDPR